MARRPPAYLEEPSRAAQEAIRKVVAAYQTERDRDPKRFRQTLLWAVRRAVPPAPPGRRGSPGTKQAARYLDQGKSWPWIYKNVIEDYGSLSPNVRRLEANKLRGRVRADKSAQRRKKGKKSKQDSCPEEIAPSFSAPPAAPKIDA